MTIEERRAYHRIWYAKHKDRLKALPSRNSEARKAYKRRYHKENRHTTIKASLVKARRTYRERNKQWFQDYKKTLACISCGEDHPLCLDFHHKDPKVKLFTIRNGVNRGKAAMLREIAKCDVLCANCHRKKTYPHLA